MSRHSRVSDASPSAGRRSDRVIGGMWFTMVRRGNIGTLIGVGLLAEVLVFAAVADGIGLGHALLLTVFVSLLGTAMLRRSGSAALAGLRSMAANGARRETALLEGMLGAIGAVLLIVPGFLTDLVGLFLLAPSGRQWLTRRLGITAERRGRPAPSPTGTIDLNTGDWTRLDPMSPR